MEINYIENIASTHLHVINLVKQNSIAPPYALYANNQYSGIGSRGNEWIGESGNLYLTFCLNENQIPKDIPRVSMSIYFACLLKEILRERGSSLWLKWPNDFYVGKRKIGGLITTKIREFYVVSVGLNLVSSPKKFGVLDIDITHHEIVKEFCEIIKKSYSWKQVFSKYKVEFQNNKNFTFHEGDKIRSLRDAILCDDGSIQIDDKKVYNLR